MVESDLLLTIAEVAVAFAGFAGLVSILGQRSSQDDPRVLGVRMRSMILFSLLAVAFSLLPLVLQRYELSERAVLRISSALFGLSFAWVGGWILLAITRLRRLAIPRRPIVRVIGAVLLCSISAGLVVLASNAFALAPPALTAPLYLTALGILLFLAGFAFTLILFSFLPRLTRE